MRSRIACCKGDHSKESVSCIFTFTIKKSKMSISLKRLVVSVDLFAVIHRRKRYRNWRSPQARAVLPPG
jgi:hypothetical protein